MFQIKDVNKDEIWKELLTLSKWCIKTFLTEPSRLKLENLNNHPNHNLHEWIIFLIITLPRIIFKKAGVNYKVVLIIYLFETIIYLIIKENIYQQIWLFNKQYIYISSSFKRHNRFHPL